MRRLDYENIIFDSEEATRIFCCKGAISPFKCGHFYKYNLRYRTLEEYDNKTETIFKKKDHSKKVWESDKKKLE